MARLLLFKKQGAATGVFFHYKPLNKVLMGFYSIENNKVMYGWVLYCSKNKNKLWLGFFSIENVEIRYS